MKVGIAHLRVWLLGIPVAAIASAGLPPVLATTAAEKETKPSITLRAAPNTGFAPTRVVLTAELKGGRNDYEEYYCATVEWDIVPLDSRGDGMKSEQKLECDPYEPGKSEIKRRYVREQVFRYAGEYNIRFTLKQKNKVVGGSRTSIRIRGGLGDGVH